MANPGDMWSPQDLAARMPAGSKVLDHDEVPARLTIIRQGREVVGQDKARGPPLMTRRSSTRRAPGWFFGKRGSMADQASSDDQNLEDIDPFLRRSTRRNQRNKNTSTI